MLRRYGVFTDREWSLEAPPARLTDEADREIWRRIVAVVRRGMKEGRTLPEASQDYVRESAFTFLNRLVVIWGTHLTAKLGSHRKVEPALKAGKRGILG